MTQGTPITEEQRKAIIDARKENGDRPVIRQIAERTGVAHATVARVLKESPPKCSRCKTQLRWTSEDTMCGFCREENK